MAIFMIVGAVLIVGSIAVKIWSKTGMIIKTGAKAKFASKAKALVYKLVPPVRFAGYVLFFRGIFGQWFENTGGVVVLIIGAVLAALAVYGIFYSGLIHYYKDVEHGVTYSFPKTLARYLSPVLLGAGIALVITAVLKLGG